MKHTFRHAVLLSGILLLTASAEGCFDWFFAGSSYHSTQVVRQAPGKGRQDDTASSRPEPKKLRNGKTTSCTFDVDYNSPRHRPHIVSGGLIVQPQLQDSHRLITLTEHQRVIVACEGHNNLISTLNTPFANATCTSGSLLIDNQNYPYYELGCKSKLRSSIRDSGKCGPSNNGTFVEIGWEVWDAWVDQIKLCHNTLISSAYYTTHTLIGKSIKAKDKGLGRPSFRKGGYFTGVDIEAAYVEQYETAYRILGEVADQYIEKQKHNKYLAKGHLSPEADFIDEGSQDATQYYFNALPQWQDINNGNWRILENSIRSLAADKETNLTLYTGGFGILTLSNEKGTPTPMYLGSDPSNPGHVPVPKLLWKLVLQQESQTGTAFIMVNNPYINGTEEVGALCEDRCKRIPWVKIQNHTSFPTGYTFCCNHCRTAQCNTTSTRFNLAPTTQLGAPSVQIYTMYYSPTPCVRNNRSYIPPCN